MLGARFSQLLSSAAFAVLLPFHLFGNTTIQANICTTPAVPPSFTTQSTSTTSATDVIDGNTSANTDLSVANNNQQVASLTSDSSGNFSLQVSLNVGSNSFTAQATNACGSVNSTGSLVITRTIPPPPPAGSASSGSSTNDADNHSATTTGTGSSTSTVTTPSGSAASPLASSPVLQLSQLPGSAYNSTGFTTTNNSVFISGRTTPGAIVIISDNTKQVARLIAASDGSFGVSVPLTLGYNRITIASTFNGKTTTQTITFIRTALVLPPPNKHQGLASSIVFGVLLLLIASYFISRWLIGKRLRQQPKSDDQAGPPGGFVSS